MTIYKEIKINTLQLALSKILLRAKGSQYINPYDKEIIEALERLFIIDFRKTNTPNPPSFKTNDFELELSEFKSQLDVYEDEATDYEMTKGLRFMLVFFLLMTIMRLVVAFLGIHDIFGMSGIYSMTATFFFGYLFIMLHLETKNQSSILLFLTCASIWIGLW